MMSAPRRAHTVIVTALRKRYRLRCLFRVRGAHCCALSPQAGRVRNNQGIASNSL
jgi:hypothetical protein